MRKWIVLFAGVALQSILGGVYAWSAFVPALTAEHGLSRGQSGLIFGLTIAVFTIVMIPAGKVLRKLGPRITAGAGAVLFTTGYLIASFSGGSFPIILIGIGVVTGAGIGAGYVCPLTVGMKWFPNNKGLVTGVAVAGFGGGAVLLSVLVQYLLATVGWGVLPTFRLVGLLFGGAAFVAAMLLREPESAQTAAAGRESRTVPLRHYVLSGPFLLLWLGIFTGTFAGLLTVGNLKPIILNSGLSDDIATIGISVFALGNAAGRIIWGQIHDRAGSRATIILSLAFLALTLVPFLTQPAAPFMLPTVALAGIGFGACFVVYAASMVEFFGTELFPRLYPICFLGYGLAGITAPGTGGLIADTTGSFIPAILLSGVILVAAIAVLGIRFPGSASDSSVYPEEAVEEYSPSA
ncbi:MAG: MFS transporter [Spirochaetaceae bacterium]